MSHTYEDIWLVDGMRTGFAEYNGTLKDVSATDLGIAAARAALAKAAIPAEDVDTVTVGNVAQTSFDAYYVARQVGLYAGCRLETPALAVQRLCASGFEAILQGADAIQLQRARVALAVGTESMSRNPVASYSHRSGFRMGQVEFKDFLWEATLDTAAGARMGDTAENLAKRYQITRSEVDDFAFESFRRAAAARDSGFHAGEIAPLGSETFPRENYKDRAIRLPKGIKAFAEDEHLRPTAREALGALKPAFNGVQTGGNSSGIVDGAAGALVACGSYVAEKNLHPLARILGGISVGCPPEIMGIGPAPAIRALLDKAGIALSKIDRFEINEAFGAQYLAVEKELGLDRNKVNVNGGAIALGHPLGATGVRCTLTLARELKKSGLKYGISSACAGGGQGIAILIENLEA